MGTLITRSERDEGLIWCAGWTAEVSDLGYNLEYYYDSSGVYLGVWLADRAQGEAGRACGCKDTP